MPATHDLTTRRRVGKRVSRRLVNTAAADETEFADNYLKIARLLLSYGRTEVARRRLKCVVDKYGNTPAAAESRNLLSAIDSRTAH